MKRISIVIRVRNEEERLRRTLEMLHAQHLPGWEIELVTVDNASTDDTPKVIQELNAAGIKLEWPAGSYKPGTVLNAAIRACSGDLIVFNNADSIPLNSNYLAALIEPLSTGRADITFGQQLPRPDARPLVVKDHERAFGDGSISSKWRHFFSLASAASTRQLLLSQPFREDIQYSEDVEWSYRLKKQGVVIEYVPEAKVEHSHNYTFKELQRRFHGEGVADAVIFGERPRFFRSLLLPLGREMLRDVNYLARHGELLTTPRELTYRVVQRWSHYRGEKEGANER